MIGIILAAGAGRRLLPFTDTLPKCLVTVGGIPILRYQLDAFKNAGVNELIIVTGYLSEKVRNYVARYNNGIFDIKIIENRDFLNTNNMYSLWLTRSLIECDILLCNGDVIFDPWIVQALCASEECNLVAVDTRNFFDESMKIIFQDDRITEINKEIPQSRAYATSIDLYRIGKRATKKLLSIIDDRYISKNNLNQWTEVALQDLFYYERFVPFDIQGKFWVEIDTPSDLQDADKHFGYKP